MTTVDAPDWVIGTKVLAWDGFTLLLESKDGSVRRVTHIGTVDMEKEIKSLQRQLERHDIKFNDLLNVVAAFLNGRIDENELAERSGLFNHRGKQRT